MKTRMRFLRHAESIGPMWPKSKSKPNPGAGTVPPPAGRPRAQVKERVGRAAPFSSSAMSSGRLSLDRVARQHCPSPFHRQAHPKSVPGSGTIDFQRTVNSVLTVCLSRGDNPNQYPLTFTSEFVGEFKVTANSTSSQYVGDRVLQVISKSGTNAFHGGGNFFIQDAALNARPCGATMKRPFRDSEFGFQLGGPIKQIARHTRRPR